MPIVTHVTGYPLKTTAKQFAYLESPLFATTLARFQKIAFKIDGERMARDSAVRELTENLGALQTAMAATEREYERLGFPGETDPKTGALVKVDWRKRAFPEFEAIKAKLRELNAMKFAGTPLERLTQWVRVNGGGKWRKFADPFADDPRTGNELLKECAPITMAAQAKIKNLKEHRVHSADAKARVDKIVDKRAASGKPSLYDIGKQMRLTTQGNFVPNTNPEIEFPFTIHRTDDGGHIQTDDVLALLFWLDPELWKNRLHAMIDDEWDDDESAVLLADLPAAIAKAETELLVAQRRQEAAYTRQEAEGIVVRRPAGWPEIVIFGIEPDVGNSATAPGATIVASASIKAGEAVGADDFEGEDA